MPLARIDRSPIADANGDVYFAMTDGRGVVPCRVVRPYLESLAGPVDHDIPSERLFEGVREIVETAASIEFDYRPPSADGTIVVGVKF